jgi:hypothetical protein
MDARWDNTQGAAAALGGCDHALRGCRRLPYHGGAGDMLISQQPKLRKCGQAARIVTAACNAVSAHSVLEAEARPEGGQRVVRQRIQHGRKRCMLGGGQARLPRKRAQHRSAIAPVTRRFG